jgi:hypothetical protein
VATKYTNCPHIQANPEKFEDHPRDDSKERIHYERVSNKHVLVECVPCMKARIRAEWAKTETGRRTLEHMRRCDLIQYVNGPQGLVLVAPEGLIERVVTPMKMPGGETIMMPGFRINNEYPVPPVLPPETIVETISETIPETKPEAPEPDAAELRTFLEPVVSANEKFVALWKQGKTGPLIGAAMRAAAGKYEGKYIEKTLKGIVDALGSDVAKDS